MVLNGIDVSNWQGKIDWDAVKAQQWDFAFIKSSESINYKDSWFDRNWTEAKRVGIVRGAYHYARPSRNTAPAEADFFLNSINYSSLEEGDILILDMEDPVFNDDVIPWTIHFLQVVESIVNFNAIIYTGPWYINSRMRNYHNTTLDSYNLWLAAYSNVKPTSPLPWSDYKLWQYSSTGKVAGIAGNVDLNYFYGTLDELKSLGKPNIEKPPTSLDVEALKLKLNELSDRQKYLITKNNSILNISNDIQKELMLLDNLIEDLNKLIS